MIRTGLGRVLIRPLGAAGGQWEGATAAVCCLALGGVLLVELLTPDDVIVTVGYLPVLAAMWALSSRFAAVVGLTGAGVLGIVLATEVANRPTVMLVGAVGVILAALVRGYARRLDGILAPNRRVASGETWLPVPAEEPVESLTRREHEVALLAAKGLTAGEIGQELHISQRTVESHLANAYAKLSIHSRAGLRRIRGVL